MKPAKEKTINGKFVYALVFLFLTFVIFEMYFLGQCLHSCN
jgi:Na+-transporting methylmalonyl-CoA/oxaloacetate decarboxylase gamma subunit